ncbi:MAG: DNA-directed RNA polymerase subunit omega [Syntrophomonadaceae bacterium]
MFTPSTKDLINIADSKYAVVVAVARRARFLSEHYKDDENYRLSLMVSRALQEMVEGKITVDKNK